MTATILGIFTERSHVEDAIDRLKTDGYKPEDISIVMKDTREVSDIGEDTGADVAGGAVSGATTGAVIGGLAGLLAGTIIPGLGAFLIGGPIAAALGLGGAAATTVSGAATGAVAGGLLGALMGLGLSRDEAEVYESRLKEGAILLAVPVRAGEETQVTRIFEEYNASDIKVVAPAEEKYSEPDVSFGESSSQYAAFGAKGGKSTDKGKGWHGESEEHAEARKGRKPRK